MECCHNAWCRKTKLKQCDDMFSRFGTTPACDRRTLGQTDRQTDIQISCHGIIRAYGQRHAAKIQLLHLNRISKNVDVDNIQRQMYD